MKEEINKLNYGQKIIISLLAILVIQLSILLIQNFTNNRNEIVYKEFSSNVEGNINSINHAKPKDKKAFDENLIKKIEIGKTTKAEIEKWFGMGGKNIIAGKGYTEESLIYNNQIGAVALIIRFDEQGIVSSFNYFDN